MASVETRISNCPPFAVINDEPAVGRGMGYSEEEVYDESLGMLPEWVPASLRRPPDRATGHAGDGAWAADGGTIGAGLESGHACREVDQDG
jgi:hypothetical protein